MTPGILIKLPGFSKIKFKTFRGAHPCHISLDATGKWAFAGNYTGGTIGLLPINNDGSLGEPVQVIQHYGNGPNTARQENLTFIQ